jgi:hypothetical protein
MTVMKDDSGFVQTKPAYFGFTASTGGSADAHNEIASVTLQAACR